MNISTLPIKKKTQIHEILQFFLLTKRIKKILIKDKMQIENADMRIIK